MEVDEPLGHHLHRAGKTGGGRAQIWRRGQGGYGHACRGRVYTELHGGGQTARLHGARRIVGRLQHDHDVCWGNSAILAIGRVTAAITRVEARANTFCGDLVRNFKWIDLCAMRLKSVRQSVVETWWMISTQISAKSQSPIHKIKILYVCNLFLEPTFYKNNNNKRTGMQR